ncbi:Peptidase S53, propeptide domain protein, partial [mine drainage metagenome]
GATTHPAVASSSNNVAGSNATISVFLNFKSGIGQYASDVQTVGSPFFRQYLTPGQIGSVFGVPTRTYDQVTSYFQSFGLTVQTYPDQVNLNLLGTPLQVEEAFHTTLQAEPLQVPGGNATTVFVNTAPLLLPNYISQLVSGITGLDGALVPNQIVQYGANVTALAANDSLNALTSSSPISNRAALNITYGN